MFCYVLLCCYICVMDNFEDMILLMDVIKNTSIETLLLHDISGCRFPKVAFMIPYSVGDEFGFDHITYTINSGEFFSKRLNMTFKS
jgi:hypothetical protein